MTANPATEEVWTKLNDDLRRFIRRRVVDDHVADDLVQETFLRIHRRIDTLKDADRLAAWVYQIARNVIHDHYRSKGSDRSLADADLVDESEGTNHLRARAADWLGELIQQLPAPYQKAVQLSEIEGLSQRAVAEQLGLSISGAKSRVQRGRRMLREVLDQCCFFHFDKHGNLMDCEPKPDRTACRDCDDMEVPQLGNGD